MLPQMNLFAWGLALAGASCTVLAAYLQGGTVAALGAAGVALTAAAGVAGYTRTGAKQ